MKQLRNRTAILTGASRGLGPYIGRALAAEGVNLVLAARSAGDLERVAEEMRALGVRAIAVPGDVTVAEDRRKLVEAAVAEFGRIDILVNNAGIEVTAHFERQAAEELAATIDVNLTSALLLTREVIPVMLEKKAGHIVNMASLAGKVPVPFSVPYAASKAGLVGFTESLRGEFRKRGVSASVICPGLVSEAGMYMQMQQDAGVKENFLAGTVTPKKVASDVVKAIRRDRPEMLVYRGPGRVVSAFAEAAPGLFERVFPVFGTGTLFRKIAEAREKQRETADA